MRWILLVLVLVLATILGVWSLRPGPAPELPSAPLPAADAAAIPAQAALELAAEPQPSRSAPAAEPAAGLTRATSAFQLRVRGTCVDAQDRPLAGVDVRCWIYHYGPDQASLVGSRDYATFGEGQDPTVASSADGGFELAFAPAKGADAAVFRVGLRFAAPGRAPAAADIELARGVAGEAGRVVLPRAGRVQGEVVDVAGAPVAGARVSVRRLDEDDRPGGAVRYASAGGTSAADGRFALEDLPAGTLDFRARADDQRQSPLEKRVFAEGEAQGGLRLVLPALDDPNTISGVVLSPAGEPVPRARIRLSYTHDGGRTSTSLGANKQGAFRHALPGRVTCRLQAEDPEQRYGGITLEAVESGTHRLELRLEEARQLALRAVDERGPVESFGWRVRIQHSPSSYQQLPAVPEAPRAEGRAQVFAVADPFFVELRAQGYAALELGPFRAGELPAEALFRLEPARGIRGLVRARGAPLAGATLELWKPPDGHEQVKLDGIPASILPLHEAVEASSDAEGRFLLPVAAAGRYHVLAREREHAPALSAVLDYVPARGLDDLLFELTPGGGLEGRVFDAEGRALAGQWIAAHDGRTFAVSVQSDGQGLFRFEHLAPGGWRLDRIEQALPARPRGWGAGQFDGDPSAARPDCVVREGETTRFDLRPAASAELVLHLSPELAALGQWQADVGLEAGGVSKRGTATWNDARDELRLAFPASGKCTLFLDLPGANPAQHRCTISGHPELGPGSTRLALDLRFGRVRGTLAGAGAATTRVFLQAQLAGGWELFGNATVDAQGQFEFDCAPAGPCRIQREVASAAREVVVVAGETLELGEL